MAVQIGDVDVADDAVCAGGNEDGDIGADAVKLGDDARVTHPDMALVAVIRIQCGYIIGREDLIAFLGVQS